MKAARRILFSELHQHIDNVSIQQNIFNVSSLHSFEHVLRKYDTFAIKYVVEGCEHYTINDQQFKVKQGSYLLLNGEKEGRVSIEQTINTKGMCINISNGIIAQVIASQMAPDTPFSDDELANFFYTDRFLENQYNVSFNHLGAQLHTIGQKVKQQSFYSSDVNEELFYHLAELLVLDQTPIFKQLQQVPSIKERTKRDLFRKLMKGKEFMLEHCNEPLSIEQIAHQAEMSEYHFFRLFKRCFGQTPYQFLLNHRLISAKALLRQGCSVSETAFRLGFSDIFTFSKAFKKHFGSAPSLYQNH